MAAQFPTSPVDGEYAVVNNIVYQYSSDTSSWTRVLTTLSGIANGSSQLSIATADGNATLNIDGFGNVVVWSYQGEYVDGLISATGNITGGNVISNGARVYRWTTQANVAPTDAVPGDNWYDSYNDKLFLYINDGVSNQWVDQSFPSTFVNLLVTGNITGGNLASTGQITAVGNIGAANVNAGGLSLSGNVVSPLNVTGNITSGNISTAGEISAANIIASGTIASGGITLNARAIDNDTQIPAGFNASSVGPITQIPGVTIYQAPNTRWMVL